jgi:hypothetical protein
MGLMKNGIWHQVIKDKYLPHGSVTTWLRSTSSITSQGSQTWKNILNTLPLVLPGSRDSIIIGKGEILGLGKESILSNELIYLLNEKNVYFLYQARQAPPYGTTCSNWLDNTNLGLEGDLAIEWERYRRNLIRSRIQLTERSDELKWTGGDNSSQLTVKNVYKSLASKLWKNKIGGWRKKLWS